MLQFVPGDKPRHHRYETQNGNQRKKEGFLGVQNCDCHKDDNQEWVNDFQIGAMRFFGCHGG
jgi:hypothetical protein